MTDTQYGFLTGIGTRNKLGTGILKTKERKCHLTNLNVDYNGNFPILGFEVVTQSIKKYKFFHKFALLIYKIGKK